MKVMGALPNSAPWSTNSKNWTRWPWRCVLGTVVGTGWCRLNFRCQTWFDSQRGWTPFSICWRRPQMGWRRHGICNRKGSARPISVAGTISRRRFSDRQNCCSEPLFLNSISPQGVSVFVQREGGDRCYLTKLFSQAYSRLTTSSLPPCLATMLLIISLHRLPGACEILPLICACDNCRQGASVGNEPDFFRCFS